MFARNVSYRLKSNMLSEYDHTFENQILPLLRKQRGFMDQITFATRSGLAVTAISLWDDTADAENFSTEIYPEVVKTLSELIEETPTVQTYPCAQRTCRAAWFSGELEL